jgi:hypothetical protein
MKRMLSTFAGLGLVLVCTTVMAGDAIKGVGSSRSEAMDDANARAKEESVKRFGRESCITFAKLESCVYDRGEWVCTAHVANHEGSCSTRR